MGDIVETQTWDPAQILTPNPSHLKRFAVIVLNQALNLPVQVYSLVFSNAIYKVGADGGANRLHTLVNSNSSINLSLDAVIGDLDSLHPDARKFWEEKGVPIIHDPDQYSTDFTKAMAHIRDSDARKAIDVVAIGGLGGRVDQGFSVLHHLYMFQKEPGYPTGRMYLLSTESITFVLKTGKHSIKVKGPGLGKIIGIIPLKEPSVITTQGLKWDVEEWETEFGGHISTSNQAREEFAVIETTKDVLFTINLDFSEGNDGPE